MTFYNTTNETGKALNHKWIQTAKQDDLVLLIFATNKEALFTPYDIQNILRDDYDKPFPITSIRRSMSTLTEREALEKTPVRKKGPFGATNYCRKYAV